MDKNLFKPLLKELNIPIEKYDDMLTYIETHIKNETNEMSCTCHNDDKLPMTTLPIALKTFSKLNLDKVHIVNAPITQSKDNHNVFKVDTMGISYMLDSEELVNVKDFEEYISNKLIEKTLDYLNKVLENKHIYIYSLFNQIKKLDDGSRIIATHRFFTSDEKLELEVANVIYYLKELEKPDLSDTSKVKEIKLGIDFKVIPEEKKLNFLTYLKEINNGIPTEKQLNTWFEREKINVL